MKTELVQSLTTNFEACAQRADSGVEFWLARDLQHLLGYSEWRNFVAVVNKGKTACDVSGHTVADHFVDVNKMVDLGSQWKVPDNRPLAEFAPTIILKAKDFAAEITIFNARQHQMGTEWAVATSTSPTTQRSATRCWNAGFDQKVCRLLKMSKKLSGVCCRKTKKRSRNLMHWTPDEHPTCFTERH